MRVSGIEWSLAITVVALAALGHLQSTYESLSAVLIVMVIVSGSLVIVSGLQSARTKSLGRFLLLGATFGFFWLGALSSARRVTPFEIGAGLPVFGGQFDLELIKKALLFIAIFQLMLLVGYSIRLPMRALLRVVARREDEMSLRGRLLPYVLAACALIPLLLSFSFDIGAAAASLTAGRGDANPAYQDVGFVSLIGFFGLYGASLLLADALLFRALSRFQKLVIGALVTAPFILGGVRHLWLFVAIPVGAVAFRMNAHRLTFGRLVRWLAAGLLLLAIVQIQLLVRQAGWSDLAELEPRELLIGDASGQFEALLVAEALVPARHAYFREPAEPYFLIHWIPRRFWPDKPIMESWTFYNDQYTGGDERFNVTPSVIGQFYLSWGIFGVLYVGGFLGFLMVCADRALLRIDPARQKAMAVAIGSFVAFVVVSYRFYSPIYFTYFAFAWIGMLFITRPRSAAHPVGIAGPASGELGTAGA